ncbi:MAG: helix-turn-helix domain-containing protein [bacterium]
MNYRTQKELAYELDVSETTVIHRCQSGYLPSYKVGGRWRIDPEAEIGNSPEVERQIREGMKSRKR